MYIKNLDLYINEKNVTTIQPYFSNGAYGLIINGHIHEFGRKLHYDKPYEVAKLGSMKALQTQIIKRIEK